MDEIILNRETPLSRKVPKKVIEVEMFKAGEHMDSDNDRARFTIRDLEDIISCYDPRTHEAPLIIGHEQNDSTPALGWVREVWRKGRSLWGKIELTPRAERIISEGTFKKVSSSFYAPEAETNPTRGKLSLRHLALVSIPAVKGLADFREPISDTITLNFSEQRSQTLFKELLESNTKHMPRQRTRKKSISDHGEGTVNLTINVSSGEDSKKLPIYDDSGSLLNESGAPADYDMDFEEDETKEGLPPTAEDDGDMPEELPQEEGEETPVPPDSPEAEGEMSDQAPEGEAADPEAEQAPEGEGEDPMAEEGGDAPTEDVSDELDDEEGEGKIAELASNYSAAELVKALAMKKQNTDLMESEASGGDTTSFSEANEEKEEADDDEETKDYACSDEKKEFPFNKKKKDDSEEDEDDKKEYAEDEKEGEDDEEDKKEYAEDDSEVSKLKDRLAALEEELQKQRKSAREKEISDFCESIYANGKLIESVVSKKELVKFMSTLNGKNTINFSESNRQSQFDFFSEVLTNLPQVVNFSEVATEANAPKKKQLSTKDDLSGFAYDTKSLGLHAEALDFAEANNVDYVTALKTVVSK